MKVTFPELSFLNAVRFNKHIFLLFLTGFATPTLAANGSAARSVDDSVKVTLTEGTNIATALSPDKQSIVMDLQGTIYKMPVGGGKAIALTDALGDCRQPVWSPDGSKIAFQAFWDGNLHIYTVEKNGGAPIQITFGAFDDREPAYSPDGKSMVFSSDRSGNYDVWSIELATGVMKQLTSDPNNDYFPSYSPDGSRVAYVSERAAAPGIYIRELAGEEKLFLTSKGKLSSPVWHPSQAKIIFNSFIDGKSLLEIAEVGGGEWQTLSDDKADVFPFKVSWISETEYLYTADGQIKRQKIGDKKVASIPFQVNVTLGRIKYTQKIRDFNSTKEVPVKGIRGPVVSPDGKTIVFTALGDLWLLKSGSAKPAAITSDAFIEIDATWSADGKQLAYVADRKGNMDLYVRNMITGAETLVLNAADNITLPAWSPDGSKIAYYQKDPAAYGRFVLKMITLSSATVTTLYETLFDGSQPSWSPDGKFVVIAALVPYSSRYREGVSKFLIISTADKSSRFITPINERTLSNRGKNGPYWSPDGTRFAFSMDGVLWTVPVDSKGTLRSVPLRLTNELAEYPSWTGDSKHIVYMATDVLKKVSLADGKTEIIPLALSYKPAMPTGQTVVYAGKLFDGRSKAYITNVDLVIEGNRIKSIEPHKAGRPGKFIDASQKVVMPGLIEMHTHQSASAGEQLGRLWLSYGITTIREPGGDPYDVIERKESWASGKRKGPRNFYTGGIMDGSRIYYGMNTGILPGAQLDLELEKARRLGFDMIKTYVRMTDAMQQRITNFAHTMGVPVSSHEIFPAMRYGVDAVEHMGATSRRGYSPKLTVLNNSYQDVTELLIKSGMNITPTASLQGGLPMLVQKDPAFFDNRQFKAFYTEEAKTTLQGTTAARTKNNPAFLTSFGNIQKTVKTLVAGGAHVTPGTDSPIIAPGFSYHAELQSWVDGGISNFETLRAATLWSAEALGVSKDLGTLENGKLADLLILDGDPMLNIKDLLQVETVIRNGEVFPINDLLRVK